MSQVEYKCLKTSLKFLKVFGFYPLDDGSPSLLKNICAAWKHIFAVLIGSLGMQALIKLCVKGYDFSEDTVAVVNISN